MLEIRRAMSFDLPRKTRGLRFTGELRAIERPEPPSPRRPQRDVRAARAGRPPERPDPRSRARAGRPPERPVPPDALPTLARPDDLRAAGARAAMPSMSDEPTLAFDRDDIGLAIEQALAPAAMPRLPVPNFRAAAPAARANAVDSSHLALPAVSAPAASTRPARLGPHPAYFAWIAAAILAGIASFHYAPKAFDGFGATLASTFALR